MFAFFDEFDYLSGDKVILKIIEKNKGNNEIVPFYYYDIYNCDDVHVGKISIRIGNNLHSYYNGHIGYEIFDEYRGNHYSYEAVRLILPVAKAHKMPELFLTCTQSNTASIKIIEKLGGIKKEVVKIPKECFFYREGIEDYCIYNLSLLKCE
ncbi:MAG: GNAT family N-acetyltransferase [Oscillospiraceae bacterium]